jgi:hypothetical protein
MTILAFWVRTSKQGMEELVMISDNRLNGHGKHRLRHIKNNLLNR